MLERRKLLVLPLTVVAVAAVAGGSAIAASGGAPKVDKIKVVSSLKVKPGFYIQDGLRFTPYKSSVKSGGTISVTGGKGAFSEGPHSFSLVKKSQLPKTAAQINSCKACGQIAQEHGIDPNSENPTPTNVLVDGGDGFNKPGDSVFFQGKGPDPLKVTAKKGTTLYYLCAVHPWMQGKVIVK
jgi:plastocyanin